MRPSFHADSTRRGNDRATRAASPACMAKSMAVSSMPARSYHAAASSASARGASGSRCASSACRIGTQEAVPAIPLAGDVELDEQRCRPCDVPEHIVDALGPEDRADHGRVERIECGGAKDEVPTLGGHRPDDLASDVLADHPVGDQGIVRRHELGDGALVHRGEIQARCPALEGVIEVMRPVGGERPADQPEELFGFAVVEDEIVRARSASSARP